MKIFKDKKTFKDKIDKNSIKKIKKLKKLSSKILRYDIKFSIPLAIKDFSNDYSPTRTYILFDEISPGTYLYMTQDGHELLLTENNFLYRALLVYLICNVSFRYTFIFEV